MSLADLLPAIRALPADDRRQLAHLLADELAAGHEPTEDERLIARCFPPGATFEVWSPIEAPEAAAVLMAMLEAEKGMG